MMPNVRNRLLFVHCNKDSGQRSLVMFESAQRPLLKYGLVPGSRMEDRTMKKRVLLRESFARFMLYSGTAKAIQKVDSVALLVDCAVQILPLVSDLDIRFIHSPAPADGFLVVAKGPCHRWIQSLHHAPDRSYCHGT
jgi:hypothetical protein